LNSVDRKIAKTTRSSSFV